MKPKRKAVKGDKRLERIEIALLDLAWSLEAGEWKGIYPQTANTLYPLPNRISNKKHGKK